MSVVEIRNGQVIGQTPGSEESAEGSGKFQCTNRSLSRRLTEMYLFMVGGA